MGCYVSVLIIHPIFSTVFGLKMPSTGCPGQIRLGQGHVFRSVSELNVETCFSAFEESFSGGGGVGAPTPLAGSTCCAHHSLCFFLFFFQRIFELFCATYSDVRSPFIRGRGRAVPQPPALVTDWITHGSVQEAKVRQGLWASKTSGEALLPSPLKAPSVLHFDKRRQKCFPVTGCCTL